MLRPLGRMIPFLVRINVFGPYRLSVPGFGSIQFDCNYTSMHGRLLFWKGIKGFEYHMTRVFLTLVKDANGFLDIGSNIGYYSLLAAKCNDNMPVVAFEPMPAALEYLRRNKSLNNFNNIDVEEVALSNRNESVSFYIRIDNEFDDDIPQLTGDSSLSNYDNVPRQEIKVQSRTLDSYLGQWADKRFDVLKLDTETTEHLVLEGASEFLARNEPVIFCEVLSGFNEDKLQQALEQFEYSYFVLHNDNVVPIEVLSEVKKYGEKNDCLFVPKSKFEFIAKFIK